MTAGTVNSNGEYAFLNSGGNPLSAGSAWSDVASIEIYHTDKNGDAIRGDLLLSGYNIHFKENIFNQVQFSIDSSPSLDAQLA